MSLIHFYEEANKIKVYKYLYLIENRLLRAYKIGITTNIKQRLELYIRDNSQYTLKDFNTIYLKDGDIKVLKIYKGENVIELEKELLKIIQPAKKEYILYYQRKGYYKEHYEMERQDIHKQVLEFFNKLNYEKTDISINDINNILQIQ